MATLSITFPTATAGFSTNLKDQTIMGTATTDTQVIKVNGSTAGIIYTPGYTTWSYVTNLQEEENIFTFMGYDVLGNPGPSQTITITYLPDSDLNFTIAAPTGIALSRAKNAVIISIVGNKEEQVLGYNFYGSEDVGGGVKGFTLLNPQLVLASKPDSFKENTIVLSENIETETTASGKIRHTSRTEEITKDYYYIFEHNRVDNPLGNKPLSEPNHYVSTTVAFDPQDGGKLVESIYSSELGTTPLILDTTIRTLPQRNTKDVQESLIDQIQKIDGTIDVKAGTITRDVMIDPPSDEFERLYIILDFLHKSQSFLTLLPFDDANNDQISDPVLTSTNKNNLRKALYITEENANSVQTLIDSAFSKLAGNVNIKRKEPQKSLGQVLLYSRRTPTKTTYFNSGSTVGTLSDGTTPTVTFSLLTDFILTLDDINNKNYYNSTTKRYEILLDIEAVNAGYAGNVDADRITLAISGIDPSFGVTNPNPTEFGEDIESNYDLSQRAILAFVSVDAGTEGGYLATTLGTPNVKRCKIISAGEELMMRDIDPLRLVHTFGKVDIYLQGSAQSSYTEKFGFTFNTRKKVSTLIQSVPYFHFKVLDDSLTIDKPIFQVIEVKNVTKNAIYDLTGYVIIGDGEVVDLDETLPTNISIGLLPTDVIQVSYRYRDSNPYVFKRQPVVSIISVTGEDSGVLNSYNFVLEKLEDPLKFGNSTSSSDKMQLVYSDVNSKPTGFIAQVSDESHLLTGENLSELKRLGIDSDTIVVKDSTGTLVYIKDVDYVITLGSQDTYTYINRTATSAISDGSVILVDYEAGEEFEVVYSVNTLLQSVQDRVDIMRHLTADVVVKGAIKTYLDFDMKVLLEEGSDQTNIDRQIRTSVAKVLSEKQIGESVYQSDIIRVVEEVNGVSHVVVPFTKMVRSTGSMVINESYAGGWVIHQAGTVTSYKSVGKLSWATYEGGGPSYLFKSVFENNIDLTLVSSSALVSDFAGRAYISSDGYVYVSARAGRVPDNKYNITYIVKDALSSRDISFCEIEYGAVGTLQITYDFIKKFKGF